MKLKFIFFVLFFTAFFAVAQRKIVQIVKGSVAEEHTFIPVVGATVVVKADTSYYAVTDAEGNFAISRIPVGNISLCVSSAGYEDIHVPSLNIVSGKHLTLDSTMKASLHQPEEVGITAFDRSKSRNESGKQSCCASFCRNPVCRSE